MKSLFSKDTTFRAAEKFRIASPFCSSPYGFFSALFNTASRPVFTWA